MTEIYEKLINEAKKAAEMSYCAYSKFPVGACVAYESGKTYSGCNIENASYGLTICAERVAISKAISEGEKTKIQAIAIYSPLQKLCYPCGACRQWLCEFAASDDLKIILENDDKIQIHTLKELLPNSFKLNN